MAWDSAKRKLLLLGVSWLLTACAGAPPEAPQATSDARPKHYVVRLEGRNFIFEQDGRPRRFGFATTRYVVASSPEEAERLAVQEIRADERLNASLLNDPSDPPSVEMNHYVEVDSFADAPPPELDYIFYRDHGDR